MNKASRFLNCLLVLVMLVSLTLFTASCKSKGEKLAEQGIVALRAEDFDALLKMKSEYDKLDAKEKKKAEDYLNKNEPQWKEKAKDLFMKKISGGIKK